MFSLSSLLEATSKHAAIRRVRKLQPAGGAGDKIFPPTYPGERQNDSPRHVFERRRVDCEEVWCVLIDSVQSQANRLEESLLAATLKTTGDKLDIPLVTVDFSQAELYPLQRITSLDAPHRIYDAIIRDSLLGAQPFMDSEHGNRLKQVNNRDASVLLELSPSTLLFGVWHSQGEGGGLGAKFPRALVSEIMGINTPVEQIVVNQRTSEIDARTAGRRTGSRIDPLGILKGVKIYQSKESATDWTPWEKQSVNDKGKPKPYSRGSDKSGKPSVINHGNIAPSIQPLGVTCDYAEHRAVITLAGLRRLHFGGDQRDAAARAMIAALGLVALAEQDTQGYALRSRCDLVCEGSAPLEIVHADGSTEQIELDLDVARKLYREAYQSATKAGFNFESLNLTPQDRLIEIVRLSRAQALAGAGGDDNDEVDGESST